jgi:hypothetical protein
MIHSERNEAVSVGSNQQVTATYLLKVKNAGRFAANVGPSTELVMLLAAARAHLKE